MGHYKANRRDIDFMLFDVLGRRDVYGHGVFSDLDEATAKEVLDLAQDLAEGIVGESLLSSDRNPPIFNAKDGSVKLPEDFKQSWRAWMDSELWRLGIDEGLGGTIAPKSLQWAVCEMVLGANPAVLMYASGPPFAQVLYTLGNGEQKRVAQLMVERHWGATMVLTEPDAGSDVGSGKTRAVPQVDGSWHLSGVKRFITSGEHDLSENIIHLVLARPEGAQAGTKGLSLFMVPKFFVDSTSGELGERNGVYVTNVEHKMGLKASTTCEVRFGENAPAVGYLVGDVHDGIAQMFKIIEFARMMVGTKAIATLSTGYLNALEYSKTRLQGADMTRMADKSAPRVPIISHPDVRRNLLELKAYSEGLRGLVLFTATGLDDVYEAELAGRENKKATALVDLLLPIVKGYGSEKSYNLLAQALQVFGGSGYLQDYPLEQYIRDAKIDTLYEGTTAIQGLDLFFRKMVKDEFRTVLQLSQEIVEFVKSGLASDEMTTQYESLGDAVSEVQAMIGSMVGSAMGAKDDPTKLYLVGLNTTRLLFALGDVIVGWLLLRGAQVAQEKLTLQTSEGDKAFYEGKIAAAKWFAVEVLPRIRVERLSCEGTDGSIMELSEDAF